VIYAAEIIDEGPDGTTLILENEDGGQYIGAISEEGLDALEAALVPYRMHKLAGEIVKAEYEASGGLSWNDYKEALARTDPEWADEMLEAGDLLRKIEREGGPR
jgi:hypothetical protein